MPKALIGSSFMDLIDKNRKGFEKKDWKTSVRILPYGCFVRLTWESKTAIKDANSKS